MTRLEDEVLAFADPPVRPARSRLPARPARSRLPAVWTDASDHERVLVLGLLLLSGGCALVAVPLALIVPGVVLTAVALGFTLGRASE